MLNTQWAKNTKTGNVGYNAKEVVLINGEKACECVTLAGGKIALWTNYELVSEESLG